MGHKSKIGQQPLSWIAVELALAYSLCAMSSVEQVEEAILKLPPEKQQELRDWLENLLEDRFELTDAFKEEIAAGKADIAAGRVRVRKP